MSQSIHSQYQSHRLRKLESQGQVHTYYRFKEKAKQFPNNVFIVFEGKEYTFRHIEKGKLPLKIICLLHDPHSFGSFFFFYIIIT